MDKLNVPIVMPAEHIACEEPDELSLMLYISYFRMIPEELIQTVLQSLSEKVAENGDQKKKMWLWILLLIIAIIIAFIAFGFSGKKEKEMK